MAETEVQHPARRTALVVGGGRGLGRAVALAYARRQAGVAVLARTASQVDGVAREVSALGGEGVAVVCDLGDAAAVQRALTQVEQRLGAIDVLVNSAGVLGPLGPTLATDPAAWEAAVQVNLLGSYRVIRHVAPGMLRRGWGRIVNVSSSAALGAGMPGGSAYSVSKAGVDLLTRSLAAEVAGSGVLVFGLHPGRMDTEMQAALRSAEDSLGQETAAHLRQLYAEGSLTDPSGPAGLIVALCEGSEHASVQGLILEYGAPARPVGASVCLT